MLDAIIIALVVAGVAVGVMRAAGIATGKHDCCSGGNGGASERRRVADRDEAHYPYSADFAVRGMSCAGCARHVEDALDSVDGTWARVDLGNGTAHVLSKRPIDADAYAAAVSDAGYRLVP